MIRLNSNNKANNRRRPNLRPRVLPSLAHPGPFKSTIIFSKKWRFQASAALNGTSITYRDLFDLLCMAGTASTAFQLAAALRLTSVEIWGPMTQTLVPVTCSIEYNSTTNNVGGVSKIKTDTSIGSTMCAHVRFAPPSDSSQSMWKSVTNSTELAFELNGPNNSVVDISLDYTLQDGETPQTVSTAVAAATPGQIYLRPLDSTSTRLLTPISYPTI